jgi:DNA polymerase-3 subunit gamma/tau
MLAIKYLPKTFDDVIGQERPVKWLRSQARSGDARHALAMGPPGGGKTSCALIYADALQCEAPNNGSPCGSCGNCRGRIPGNPNPNTTIIDCVRRGRFEDFESAFRPLRSQPMFGRRHVVILDEVHGASKKAIEATLRILETPGEHTLILTTDQPELLPRTVLQRCTRLEFHPVPFEASLNFLKSICDKEKISYDVAGLSLVVENSGGAPREMLNQIDAVAEGGGPVNESEVRRVLNLDYVDKVATYLNTVFSKDLQAQMDALDCWTDGAAKKAAAIEAFIAFVFTTDILRIYRRSQLMEALPVASRLEIVQAVRTRSVALKFDERRFWQEILEFWKPESVITEASLVARAVRFDQFMNIERA